MLSWHCKWYVKADPHLGWWQCVIELIAEHVKGLSNRGWTLSVERIPILVISRIRHRIMAAWEVYCLCGIIRWSRAVCVSTHHVTCKGRHTDLHTSALAGLCKQTILPSDITDLSTGYLKCITHSVRVLNHVFEQASTWLFNSGSFASGVKSSWFHHTCEARGVFSWNL